MRTTWWAALAIALASLGSARAEDRPSYDLRALVEAAQEKTTAPGVTATVLTTADTTSKTVTTDAGGREDVSKTRTLADIEYVVQAVEHDPDSRRGTRRIHVVKWHVGPEGEVDGALDGALLESRDGNLHVLSSESPLTPSARHTAERLACRPLPTDGHAGGVRMASCAGAGDLFPVSCLPEGEVGVDRPWDLPEAAARVLLGSIVGGRIPISDVHGVARLTGVEVDSEGRPIALAIASEVQAVIVDAFASRGGNAAPAGEVRLELTGHASVLTPALSIRHVTTTKGRLTGPGGVVYDFETKSRDEFETRAGGTIPDVPDAPEDAAATPAKPIDVSGMRRAIQDLASAEGGVRTARVQAIEQAPGEYAPPVFYVLAQVLFDGGRSKDAAFWLTFGRLRARIDAQRCADRSARSAVPAMERRFSPELLRLPTADPTAFAEQAEKVIALDEKTPRSYDHRWINLHGMGAMIESLGGEKPPAEQSLPEDEWPGIFKAQRDALREASRRAVEQAGREK